MFCVISARKRLVKKYVRCFNCKSHYHFSPCCPLSELTYSTMTGEKRVNWRCQVCKPRNKSPNILYQTIVLEENTAQKQLREDDNEEDSDRSKKYKESLPSTSINEKLTSLENGMEEMRTQMNFLVSNANATQQLRRNS